MSELAQRIITSHKEAARRAAEHLAKTRKLKLSSTESLELVAKVLGVANWQTLHGLAQQEKGPRIDDGKSVAPAAKPEAVSSITQAEWEQKLADYFAKGDSWGEHPDFPRSDWSYQVENGDTSASYWCYVLGEIEARRQMFPWELDDCFAAQLAKAAGIRLEYDYEEDGDFYPDWNVLNPGSPDPLYANLDSEEEAWVAAAEMVCARVRVMFPMEWDKADKAEKLRLAAAAYDKPVKVVVVPTESNSRQLASAMAIAKAAGTQVELRDGMWRITHSQVQELLSRPAFSSEEDAWVVAALGVLAELVKLSGIHSDEIMSMPASIRKRLLEATFAGKTCYFL